ncbi:MAG TPA: RNA 2',3'-cyclic phosphodiesterase [Anaerolineales bacterium]|nr:RNA 2',3'-cyclic phosphodiesterase [Anaerolineales bacterium]
MPSELIRAFVAVELAPSLRQAVLREMGDLRSSLGDSALRWLRPEAIHLTLCFLGESPPEKLIEVGEIMTQICERHPPLTAQVGGLGRFPGGSRPRVIWIGVRESSGGLAAVQADLEVRIAKLGYRSDERSFHPHLTLARVRREVSPSGLRQLAEQLDRTSVGELGQLDITHLSLMRSQLGVGGASYNRLSLVEFAGN